jgi:hypothetical protein
MIAAKLGMAGPEGLGRKNFKIETQCNLVAVIVLPRISKYLL